MGGANVTRIAREQAAQSWKRPRFVETDFKSDGFVYSSGTLAASSVLILCSYYLPCPHDASGSQSSFEFPNHSPKSNTNRWRHATCNNVISSFNRKQ